MEQYSLPQRALAEVLGTALLVLVGPGSVVATLVLAGDSKPAITGADLLGISFAFGLIIAALTVSLRAGAALAGLLLIPLAVPLLIFGAGALSTGGQSGLALTAAISLLLCAIAPFAGGAAIRAAREG